MKVTLLKSHMGAQGGLERVTEGLVQAFVRHGADVTLLTTEGRDNAERSCQVINLGYRSKFSLKHHMCFDQACQAWLKHHPQDVVFGLDRNRFQTHYRAGNGVHAAYLAHRMRHAGFGKRLSLWANPLHRFLLQQEKRAFTSPSLRRLFTNSTMVKREIQEFYDVAEEKLVVIPNGVDWKGVETAFLNRTTKRPFTFLFVGNDYRRKGLSFILNALPLLSSYHFRFLIVGKSKGFHPSSPAVTYCGQVPSLTPFYQQADALVIPSLYDPCANVTVEALAMGLFVISSRFNGGHELLTPHTGTIIDDLHDPQCVAVAMRQALARPHDPLLIRRSVEALDFSRQLDKMVRLTLND